MIFLLRYTILLNRIICIIGDMLELGKMANTYHLKATKVLVKLKPQIIITVGEYSKLIFDNLPESFLKFHYHFLLILITVLNQFQVLASPSLDIYLIRIFYQIIS